MEEEDFIAFAPSAKLEQTETPKTKSLRLRANSAQYNLLSLFFLLLSFFIVLFAFSVRDEERIRVMRVSVAAFFNPRVASQETEISLRNVDRVGQTSGQVFADIEVLLRSQFQLIESIRPENELTSLVRIPVWQIFGLEGDTPLPERDQLLRRLVFTITNSSTEIQTDITIRTSSEFDADGLPSLAVRRAASLAEKLEDFGMPPAQITTGTENYDGEEILFLFSGFERSGPKVDFSQLVPQQLPVEQ